jgi:transcriptional regulator with XRE-family HTH domain
MNTPHTIGQIIRILRIRKAWSQEQLAEEAKVKKLTLREIETGKTKPRFQTIRKIARALGVPPEALTSPTFFSDRQLNGQDGFTLNSGTEKPRGRVKIKATRIIPFFSGNLHSSSQIELPVAHDSFPKSIQCHQFIDGFSVIIIEETMEFADPVQMLEARRDAHLNILQNQTVLLNAIERHCSHPIFQEKLPKIDYVMSVHQLLNPDDHSKNDIYAICEPSLVGITDDPSQQDISISDAYRILGSVDINTNRIFTIKTKNCCFYVSWSNVVLADSNLTSPEYQYLVRTQITLQKLWFQINSYDTYIDGCIQYPNRYDVDAVAREVNTARLQVSNFCKVISVGSAHINELKSALVATSQIMELSRSINEKLKMLCARPYFTGN